MLKKVIGVLIAVLLTTILVGAVTAIDPTQNETITMNGVKFDAPITGNYTITDIKAPNGAWTWTYDDPEHEVYVYVCDERAPEYSVNEEWSDIEGYTQMRPDGEKWVVVCSMDSGVKDMIFMSARAESEP
jgi:hypothetical protein